jgi:hypothetical protein
MAVFLFSLNVYGDNFNPDEVIPKIKGKYIISGKQIKGNKIPFKNDNINMIYNYNGLSFWNPTKFGRQHEGETYEEWFVNFLEDNYQTFIDLGVERIDIFMNVYTVGREQCNFEIFNKDMLKRLSKFGVSLPIDVYNITKKEMKELIQ